MGRDWLVSVPTNHIARIYGDVWRKAGEEWNWKAHLEVVQVENLSEWWTVG